MMRKMVSRRNVWEFFLLLGVFFVSIQRRHLYDTLDLKHPDDDDYEAFSGLKLALLIYLFFNFGLQLLIN